MSEPKLRRSIGLGGAIALSFNGAVAASIFAGALAISGSFVWLAVVSTLARMFAYEASIAALPIARRRSGMPIGPTMWPVIIGGLVLCVWVAAQSSAKSWTLLGALFVVGLVLYAFAARGKDSSTTADSVSAMTPPPSTRDPS